MRHIATYLVCVGLLGCATAGSPPQPRVQSGDALKLVLPNYPGPGESNLGALKGKVVLIDFWATWCGPCHEAASAYEKLYQRYKPQGLEVYGVSVDEDSNEIADFVKQQGVTYPIVLDPSAQLASSRFDVQSIPSVLLVDRAGKIRFAHAGFDDTELATVTRELEQLLAEPARP